MVSRMSIFSKIKSFFNRTMSYLYHSECVFCKCEIPLGNRICTECKQEIYKRRSIRKTPHEFTCFTAFKYSGKAKESILRFKFGGHKEYAGTYAFIVCNKYRYEINSFNADIITCVPLSRRSYKKRGYNQSELIAQSIAILLKKPYNNVLRKIKTNRIQHTLKKDEREYNVKNVYTVSNKSKIANKRIILCDDIITTGWTLNECAETLIKAGAADVLCIAMADVRIDK